MGRSSCTRSTALLVLVAVVLAACFVGAVDRSKFKTCEQSSFCRRTRRLSEPGAPALPGFALDAGSIRITAQSFSAVVHEKESGKALQLQVRGLESGAVRVTLREHKSPHSRYEVQGALVQLKQSNVVYRPKPKTISVGSTSKVALSFDPFSLEFFAYGKSVIKLNERSLLSWEFYRTDRPAEGADVAPDEDGLWAEKFDTHEDSKPHGPLAVGMDVTFVGTPNVYGIPEHATDLDLPSTRGAKARYSDPYRLYNLDVFEYELDNPMALYGHVPFMMAHSADSTVGMLWLNAAETWIDVDREALPGSTSTHWMSESGIIDVFLLPGNSPQQVLQQYAGLTGAAALPPRFAIGYHQCKWNYKSEMEVDEVDTQFDKYDIPYDVIWLDIEHTDGKRYFTWDKRHFPTPNNMLRKIARKGRRMVTIVDPHIKRVHDYSVHKAAEDAGFYVKNRDGADYEGWCWPGSSSWPDFSRAEVRKWWADLFRYDAYVGSSEALFTWNDMNEPSVFNGPEVTMHKDAKHGDAEHRDLHNIYGMYVHQATVEGQIGRNQQEQQEQKMSAARPFVLSRAFFAGTQRYGAIWTGDNDASWPHLAASQPMLMSLGLAGISFAGADVGGFFGDPEPELLARWYQAGAYQPFFRGHAHLDSKRREPYLFKNPYLAMMRNAIRERYAILPYLYTLFHEASLSGYPVMRPLFFEFPRNEKTYSLQHSFMLGPALLVRPVTEASVSEVDVYLPEEAKWYDAKTLLGVAAGEQRVATPLQHIPVFVRGGSILARQERTRRSSTQMLHDPFTLWVAPSAAGEAEGHLYYDDGTTFDYREKQQYIYRSFSWHAGKLVNKNIALHQEPSPFDNAVEKIVVMGVPSAPIRVLHDRRELQFDYDAGNLALVIRKPNVSVGAEWVIEVVQEE